MEGKRKDFTPDEAGGPLSWTRGEVSYSGGPLKDLLHRVGSVSGAEGLAGR